MKRRQLLLGGSAVGLVAGASSSLFALAAEPGDAPLTRARLLELVGEPFEIVGSPDARAERLVLAALQDGPASPGTDQFALVFRGEKARGGRSGTRTLRHARAGRFELYLDASADAETAYRASFSLLA
jgi:hypothetical protein